ncbi:MAG TPA: hypothetical protein VGN69_01055, partial [Solirubrobacteraceae bacterium]|nr:hypothetical protein [Solirubrobacteraceae bacterium]
LISLIALRLWGPLVGLLAGSIAAVYPPLVLVGSSLMSESVFIPLVLAAVLAALAHRDSAHRWRWAFASGVLIGLAALTRSSGLALALPLCLLVFGGRPRLSRRALGGPLLLALATALTLVPWTVRNALVMHAFVPVSTQSGIVTVGAYNDVARRNRSYPALWVPAWWVPAARSVLMDPRLDEPGQSARLNQQAISYVRSHPAYPLSVAFWSVVRMFNLPGPELERRLAPSEGFNRSLAVISVYSFWLLAALALIGGLTRLARRAPAALWACPTMVLLSSVLIMGDTRYRAPADPFVVMLAALGVAAGWRRLRDRPSAPGLRRPGRFGPWAWR